MTAPLRLYMHSLTGPTPPLLVASCYAGWHNMPSLWQLLLSDAAPMVPNPAIANGAPAICADVREALVRCHFLTWRIRRHPVLPRLPTLPVFLDGALCFLRDCRRRFSLEEQGNLIFVACDAHGDEAEEPDEVLITHARHVWEVVQEMGARDTWYKLDDALRFRERRMHFSQWRAWAKTFGLETLNHPYFARLEFSLYYDDDLPAPSVLPYHLCEGRPDNEWTAMKKALRALLPGVKANAAPAANDPLPPATDAIVEGYDGYNIPFGEEAHDPWAGTGFREVRVNGKCGLRFEPAEATFHMLGMDPDDYVDPNPSQLALDAVWDELRPGHPGAWARRGAQWGMIALLRHCRVVLEPCFDDVVQEPESWASHVVVNGKRGLICTDTGAWDLAPQFDEMVWSDEGRGGLWRVRQGARWGLVSAENKVCYPCTLDCMPHYASARSERAIYMEDLGFHLRDKGREGWALADGTVVLTCAWDEVEPCKAEGLYAVRRGPHWGLAAAGDVILLPCEYLRVKPLVLGNHLADPEEFWSITSDDCWPSGSVAELLAAQDNTLSNLLVAVTTADGTGVVDQAGRNIMPNRYAEVEEVRNGSFGDARWLHLTGADGKKGLWNVEERREVFPCVHERVDMYVAPGFHAPLAGTYDDERYRLWNANGSAAWPQAFRWLSSMDGSDGAGSMETFDGWPGVGWATQIWHEGRPIRGALDDEAETRVLVQPGQPLRGLLDYLAQEYEVAGKLAAALELANDYRYQGELELAREWAAKACGYTPLPERAARQLTPLSLEERQEAAGLFARLLARGEGGPRDAVLAREWARKTHESPPHARGEHRLLLGRLLLDPEAGPVDTAAAWQVLDDVSPTGPEAPMAGFYKARCMLAQANPDTDCAIKLLAQADAIGVDEATQALADLLESLAVRASFLHKRALRKEAAHYLDKQAYYRELDDDDDDGDDGDDDHDDNDDDADRHANEGRSGDDSDRRG